MQRLIILLAAALLLALAMACAVEVPEVDIPAQQESQSEPAERVPTATRPPLPTSTPTPAPTATPVLTFISGPTPVSYGNNLRGPYTVANAPRDKEPFILHGCYVPNARITLHSRGFYPYQQTSSTVFTFTDDGQFDVDSAKAVVTGFVDIPKLQSTGCYDLAVQFNRVKRLCHAPAETWGNNPQAPGRDCQDVPVFRLIAFQSYELVP